MMKQLDIVLDVQDWSDVPLLFGCTKGIDNQGCTKSRNLRLGICRQNPNDILDSSYGPSWFALTFRLNCTSLAKVSSPLVTKLFRGIDRPNIMARLAFCRFVASPACS
jgi:hypothetical protein